ncbi:hypothetical protein DY000_02002985 [Brassica cretica]|uniref:D-fructose-1,6-bisphosphate 1-phosphohydrolase n=1 Tax=Brassica cretica TaxID=69181 RepID=A0ABQ7CFT8_BRACR|nr:hypothetical protein DY000_02002985 [Brassica cretica]
MYSSSVIFVLILGKDVCNVRRVCPHAREHLDPPKSGKYTLSTKERCGTRVWRKYIDDLKDPGPSGKSYSLRYIGSLVVNFHRSLLYSGIYGCCQEQKRNA